MPNKIKAVFYDETGKWKMKKTTTIILAGVIVVIALFIIVPLIFNNPSGTAAFQTETLGKGQLTAQVGATGTIHSDQTANLSWKTTGTIEKINTSIGDKVKKARSLRSFPPPHYLGCYPGESAIDHRAAEPRGR